MTEANPDRMAAKERVHLEKIDLLVSIDTRKNLLTGHGVEIWRQDLFKIPPQEIVQSSSRKFDLMMLPAWIQNVF